MRKIRALIFLIAFIGVALATVLAVQQVGEAGAGDSNVSRGGYVREARLIAGGSAVRVVFVSGYSGTVRVAVNVNGATGVTTATVSPGANVITVGISPPVADSQVTIEVSVNRVL